MIAALREAFTANFDTGEVFRMSCHQRPDLVGKLAGRVDNHGYVRICFNGRKLLRSHIVFALYHGRFPAKHVDHINRVRTDDRPTNLREAEHCENMWNRTQKKGRVVPMGVFPRNGKFTAKIMHKRKLIYLGRFATQGEAEAAYQAKRRELYGQFA